MSDKKTFGEFFDEMMKTKNPHGEQFMKDWKCLVSEKMWKETVAPDLLDDELAMNFMEDAHLFFFKLIRSVDDEQFRADATKSGHEFFREIQAKLLEFGIHLDIDIPLSPSDAIAMSQEQK